MGLALGLMQPVAMVAVGGFGVAAGLSFVGILFGISLLMALVAGLAALFWPHEQAWAVSAVALSAALAIGILVGNVLAASLHITFATPRPQPTPLAPVGSAWTPTGNLHVARSGHAAVRLADGRVLVAGGMSSNEAALASAEVYDPQAGTWAETGNLLMASSEGTATLLNDGRVLLTSYDGEDVELYDPRTGTWSTTGRLNTPRRLYGLTLLRDGRVLVTGGVDTSAGSILASTELYDPASGTWAPGAPMGKARSMHSATLLNDGRVLVAGGETNSPNPSESALWLAAAELYDPATGTWSDTGTMELERGDHTAALLADGRVLVVAGTRDLSVLAEIYDPAQETWQLAGSLQTWLRAEAAITLPDGTVLIVHVLGGLETYNPSTEISQDASDPKRGSASVTLLTDGRVLFAGGSQLRADAMGASTDVLSSTYLYNPG